MKKGEGKGVKEMSCQAVENGEAKRKGKPSIEHHDDNGKPVYYCYGYIDNGTEDLIEICSKCRKNVIYAQRDFEQNYNSYIEQ